MTTPSKTDLVALAPCPFCGGSATESAQYPHVVVCEDRVGCGAVGPNHFFKRVTRDAWNNRAALVSAPVEAPVADSDVRWAVNYLLEQIAKKFEEWDTDDIWKSRAAETVREFKHDLIATPRPLPSVDERRGIYVASKTKHADRWRFLRDKIGEPIISTWINEAGEGETGDFHDLWSRCLSEAARCAVLIAYRESGEIFKGGWIEIGAALANGIPVYAVGLEDFTIAKYRGITHFPDMKSAVAASRSLTLLGGSAR